MIEKTPEQYLEFITRDVETLRKTGFTGNIEFVINLTGGQINNMNCYRNTSSKDDYVDLITKDLKMLTENHFTGNVGFRVNLKEGGLANTNCSREKSIKI